MDNKIYVVSKVGKVCRECGGKLLKDSNRRPICKNCGLFHFTLEGCCKNKKMIKEESIVNKEMTSEVFAYIKEQETKSEKLHSLLSSKGE